MLRLKFVLLELSDDHAHHVLLRRTIVHALPRTKHYIKVLQDEFQPKDHTRIALPSKLAIFVSQNKARANASSWTHDPWKTFQTPDQLVQAELDAETSDAPSLRCEGKHDRREEIERDAETVF